MSKKNILYISFIKKVFQFFKIFFWNFNISTNNLIRVEDAKVLLRYDKYSLSTYL
jgi:hypothetical protein